MRRADAPLSSAMHHHRLLAVIRTGASRAGRVDQDAGRGGLKEPSLVAPADTDLSSMPAGRSPDGSTCGVEAMMRKIGTRALAVANVGLPFGAMMLVSGTAHAFQAPAQGDLGYDIYDIVVNKGVKGPLGFVGGVAAFLFGVSRLFSNIMIGIPTIVAAVCLIKADSILQTFGMIV
jgi:hypothetical protein